MCTGTLQIIHCCAEELAISVVAFKLALGNSSCQGASGISSFEGTYISQAELGNIGFFEAADARRSQLDFVPGASGISYFEGTYISRAESVNIGFFEAAEVAYCQQFLGSDDLGT